MTSSGTEINVRKNRLLWRCRQGTRELELLLYRYIDVHYDSLSSEQLQLLDEFVEQTSDQLNKWLLGNEYIFENNRYKYIIKAIKEVNNIQTQH